MALPTENQQWPPESWRTTYNRYALHAAWYSGVPEYLASVYELALDNPLFAASRFWARQASKERAAMLHVPLAADIAKTSASLLFGDHPKFKVVEAHQENAPAEATAAQETLNTLLDEGAWYRRLHEAAESASALGGVLLKLNWDPALSAYPILSVVQADSALPEFRFGRMVACTVWETILIEGGEYVRWVERHEPGTIETGVYRGTSTALGRLQPLDAYPETRGIQPKVSTGLDGLAIVYVPNILPNRIERGSSLGASDYQGSETMLDALDEDYTSWLQDVILGKARMHLPESMLNLDSTDGKLKFKVDQEFYVGLNAVEDVGSGLAEKLHIWQGDIRAEAFGLTVKEKMARIINAAGYSPNTFGLEITGAAESGTALRTKHHKSVVTTAQKADYWVPALNYLALSALVMYRAKLGGKVTPSLVAVEMQDSIPTDWIQTCTSVELVRRAGSMSVQVAVETLHPDWTPDQVAQEVARIGEESAALVPSPDEFGGGQQDGGPEGDDGDDEGGDE